MAGQPGFFDLSDRYEALSAAGDPLERLSAVVDFELFRALLVAALRRGPRNKGRRPPFDPVLMFKILVLQALYSLSDEATEFQIKDRLSFQPFLGVGLEGTVPDVTTVWLFRERLVKAKAIDRLFARFDAALKDRGYLAIPMFGYNNHIGIDQTHGLIRTWDASAAKAHDGARLPDLISKENTASGVWADTAYRSKKNEAFLARGMFTSNIHQKRLPRRALPERIARANARRPKVRAAVEHVFAGQKHRMGLVVRTIGIARARIKIGMANLIYNFQRLVWLESRAAPA
ncbi:Transposase and inactivated derivatives, IS5 family [Sphingobium sp. AP50]|uniref:transposase n=1 Tax=Sphingobium sp. AP50 TaxID=1884369 RepID=UPI0008B6F6AB|nr:transposase [Sphingobium sp. AP50]SEJ65609.1 Transposase and inactivated derivatives, IS5 family [Sphingobium sp. AP50]